nr:hypothetical protein [Nostoc sp. SerVER01]
HVETRFIASKRLTRSQDAINRRLYREFTRQLFVHRLLFPTCVYTVASCGEETPTALLPPVAFTHLLD